MTYNKGVGNKNQTLTMNESAVNFGASSVIYNNNDGEKVSVDISPLDELVSCTEQVNLIKIDVEGMEYKVLLGAERIIDECQPIIVFEQHENEFINGESDTPSTKLLKDKNYSFLWLEDKYSKRYVSLRKLIKFVGLLRGDKRNLELACSDSIPRKTHTLLIAIPQRFSSKIVDLL